MKIAKLISDLESWKRIPIFTTGTGDKKKLVAFGRKETTSDNKVKGWTYVYTVGDAVKYIGNTDSDLKSRILPELNQRKAVSGIRNNKLKLSYTNIRLSQLLMNEIEEGNEVCLYYLTEFKWVKNRMQDDSIVIKDHENFHFDKNFLLCWHPIALQPISNEISIETVLILEHLKQGKQLPPWNLGLG